MRSRNDTGMRKMLIMMAGRKRHKGVARFPCGKSRGEPEHAIKAVAWAYRAREVGEARKNDPLAGFTLGLLRLRGPQDPGGISEAQFEAGWQYACIATRHASIMGYSIGSPKSPGFEMVAGGISVKEEPKEEVILRVRRQFTECYDALTGEGTRVAAVTYDVCVDRMSFVALQSDEAALGNLKVGLNALGRVLR